MQKILVLITVLALSTTALAFGGGGSGRKSTAFTSGVDAVGVHFNGSACNDVACKANEIVNACSLLYVVASTKNESGDITYESVLGMRPTGLSELKYNSGVITANITDAAVCTEVKNKLGDKVSGECSALTVTLGEVNSVKTAAQLEGQPCTGGDASCGHGGPYDPAHAMVCMDSNGVDSSDGVCSCMAVLCGDRCINTDCSLTSREQCIDAGYDIDQCNADFGE